MQAVKACRVAPFGNVRIKAYVRLPEPYRSLSRPSSPRDAKASIVRPYTLGRTLGARHQSRASTLQSLLFPDYAVVKDQTPACAGKTVRDAFSFQVSRPFHFEMVGVPGIEPGTSSLSGTRSNQLSYTPGRMVEAAGVEPATSSLQSWRSTN